MQCQSCNEQAAGKSQYCQEHRRIAHDKWVSMIHATAAERDLKQTRFETIWKEAVEAGCQAGQSAIPTSMIVEEHENMLDDHSPVKKSYFVGEGVCGFA